MNLATETATTHQCQLIIYIWIKLQHQLLCHQCHQLILLDTITKYLSLSYLKHADYFIVDFPGVTHSTRENNYILFCEDYFI